MLSAPGTCCSRRCDSSVSAFAAYPHVACPDCRALPYTQRHRLGTVAGGADRDVDADVGGDDAAVRGPMIRTYCEIADTAATRANGVVHPLVLVAGYLAVWFVAALGFAVMTLAAPKLGAVKSCSRQRHGSRRHRFSLPALISSAASSMPAWRNAAIPFSILFARWTTSAAGIFRLGAEQGVWCLGCCWASDAGHVRRRRYERLLDGPDRPVYACREGNGGPVSQLDQRRDTACVGCRADISVGLRERQSWRQTAGQ